MKNRSWNYLDNKIQEFYASFWYSVPNLKVPFKNLAIFNRIWNFWEYEMLKFILGINFEPQTMQNHTFLKGCLELKHCMIFAWRVVIHFKSKASFMYFFIVTAVVLGIVMIYIYFFRTFALNFFAKNLVKCAKLPKNFQLHYYYFWNEKKSFLWKSDENMISFNHFSCEVCKIQVWFSVYITQFLCS